MHSRLPFKSKPFTVSGVGITNNSGVEQNFVVILAYNSFVPGALIFTNSATAGTFASITNEVTGYYVPANTTQFLDSSSADHAKITNRGSNKGSALAGLTEFWNTASAGNAIVDNYPAKSEGLGGTTTFHDSSNAGNGTFTNKGRGSETSFLDSSSAGSAIFTNEGAAQAHVPGGLLTLFGSSTLDHASITATGGTVSNADGGGAHLYDTATAADGAFTLNGSDVVGAGGGFVQFHDSSMAGDAIIVANAGVAAGTGGYIEFWDASTGDMARVEVFGNGNLNISTHDAPGVTIGSLEGDGLVSLGTNNLTVGSSSLTTTFAGVIQDAGSLTKIGAGQLTLSGANTYTGGTTVSGGNLLVANTAGSATGTGPVQVDAGTLGGNGSINGAVIVGTVSGAGAFLAPARGAKRLITLTLRRGLTFKADATYSYRLSTRRVAGDKVVADELTIESGAQSFTQLGRDLLTPGTVFTAINNTGSNPIAGTFANLPDGSTFRAGRNKFQVSYKGGTGNDLTLTVVP